MRHVTKMRNVKIKFCSENLRCLKSPGRPWEDNIKYILYKMSVKV